MEMGDPDMIHNLQFFLYFYLRRVTYFYLRRVTQSCKNNSKWISLYVDASESSNQHYFANRIGLHQSKAQLKRLDIEMVQEQGCIIIQ